MVSDPLFQCQETVTPVEKVSKHEEDSQIGITGKRKPSVARTSDFSRETKSQFFICKVSWLLILATNKCVNEKHCVSQF